MDTRPNGSSDRQDRLSRNESPRVGDIAARIRSFHATRDFMSSHHQARATSSTGSRLAPGVNLIIVISLAIALPGCAARPAVPFSGADPADPASPTPAAKLQTKGFFVGERPADPAPWTKTSAASESGR
jgi:hypothetical protein